METIITGGRTIDDLKNDFSDKKEKLEEALITFLYESDRKIIKLVFSDNWKFLSKIIACFCEYFKSLNEYHPKPVTSVKIKTSSPWPSGEKIERRKLFYFFHYQKWRRHNKTIPKNWCSFACLCVWEFYKSINQRIWYQFSVLCKLTRFYLVMGFEIYWYKLKTTLG